MWLLTPIGFFSIVQKPSDQAAGTLTVRARVKSDLEALRASYLPSLGVIQESLSNDYRFRAVAPQQDVSAALAQLVAQLDYSNFKNEVAKQQGSARAQLYHGVWDVLYQMQTLPGQYAAPQVASTTAGMKKSAALHPRCDEKGKPVQLKHPSTASPLDAWDTPTAVACVVPDGPMPAHVNGLHMASWADHPTHPTAWEALAAKQAIAEPELKAPAGFKLAAGVVVREADGRVWLVAPSNVFGGYRATFPKGTMDGLSAQATAIVEAFEESGLKVRLLRHLIDVTRTQSHTRYYLAERVSGNPADMGWESQAVMLAPQASLSQLLNSPYDQPIVQALKQSKTDANGCGGFE